MPIITIDSFPPKDVAAIPPMLAEVRKVGAGALGCAPTNLWVIFRALPPGHYGQGETPAESPQADAYPPIVTIMAQSGRTDTQRNELVAAVADAVASGLSVPAGNVWIYYHEMRPEDVWFGNRWAR